MNKLHRTMAAEGFRQGFEYMMHRMIHLGLLGLTSLQFSKAGDINDVFDIFQGGDKYAIKSLAYKVNQNEAYKNAAMWAATIPLWWGLIKGSLATWIVYKNPYKEASTIVEDLSNDRDKGLWADNLRWALPLHPMSRHLNNLSRVIRWDGRLNEKDRRDLFNTLVNLHNEHAGYTRIETAFELAKIASSEEGREDKSSLFRSEAVNIIKSMADEQYIDSAPSNFTHRIYGHYLLWWLGLSTSKVESTAFWSFKATKMAINAFFLKTVIDAIESYLSCPNKKGQSFTGPENWSSSYSEGCFDEFVKQFNRFPGQPAHTLIDLIPNYYFPTGEYSLNLGGKGIETPVLTDILQGFLDHQRQGTGPTLVGLDLSGNGIGSGDGKNSDPTISFAKVLGEFTHLRDLDLSRNEIGNRNLPSFTRALHRYNFLKKLNISNNFLAKSRESDVVLDKFLSIITSHESLEILDISSSGVLVELIEQVEILEIFSQGNSTVLDNINFRDYLPRANIISKFLKDLSGLDELRSLSIADNFIGIINLVFSRSNTTGNIYYPLSDAIRGKNKLRELNLSNNLLHVPNIERNNSFFDFISSLSQVISLRKLEFYNNKLCSSSSTHFDIRAFASSLGRLKQLEYLGLGNCGLGEGTSQGYLGEIAPFANAFSNMTFLRGLDLKENELGINSVGNTIFRSLAGLDLLEELDVSSNGIGSKNQTSDLLYVLVKTIDTLPAVERVYLTSNPIRVKDALNFTREARKVNILDVPVVITSREDVDLIFREMQKSTDTFDFSQERSIDGETLVLLMKKLLEQHTVKQLRLAGTLSVTYEQIHEDQWLIFWQQLGQLKQLESLDLSNNFLAMTNSTRRFAAMRDSLANLTGLRSLKLANNLLGAINLVTYNGTTYLSEAFKKLNLLRVLDISNNLFGESEWETCRQMLKSLGLDYELPSGTGGEGSIYFLNSLGRLEQLEEINLSSFGSSSNASTSITTALGENISNWKHLKVLSLDITFLGEQGMGNATGVRAICSGISHLKNLEFLDFGGVIHDKEATSILLQALPHMTHLQTVKLPQFANVEWTDGAKALSVINRRTLKSKCQAEMCHGTSVNGDTSKGNQLSSNVVIPQQSVTHFDPQIDVAHAPTTAAVLTPQPTLNMADYDMPAPATTSDLGSSHYFNAQTITTDSMPHIVLAVFCGILLYKLLQKIWAKIAQPALTHNIA